MATNTQPPCRHGFNRRSTRRVSFREMCGDSASTCGGRVQLPAPAFGVAAPRLDDVVSSIAHHAIGMVSMQRAGVSTVLPPTGPKVNQQRPYCGALNACKRVRFPSATVLDATASVKAFPMCRHGRQRGAWPELGGLSRAPRDSSSFATFELPTPTSGSLPGLGRHGRRPGPYFDGEGHGNG